MHPKHTFYVTSDPDVSGVLDRTAVAVDKDGIVLRQNGDTIVLDQKQIKQLISELTKEFSV